MQQIMEEHSQERYDVLAKLNTQGKLFSVTGGVHLTSDDIFISDFKWKPVLITSASPFEEIFLGIRSQPCNSVLVSSSNNVL